MFIHTNLPSMNSQRHFNKAVVHEVMATERIASGLRINDAGAERALLTIDLALDELSAERNKYGSLLNRFESAIRSLETSRVSTTLAQSRIQDADLASEVSQLTKTQLIQQAGSSILSQVNSQPSIVLSLVG